MDQTKAKILLVDDAPMVRVMLKRLLTQLGYASVDEAGGGREAVTKIQDAFARGEPYALVFCDWMMEDLDGIHVLETCRKSESLKALPIIMVTAESEQKSIVRAMKAGANDYIVKPFTADIIAAKIDHVFAKLRSA